VGLPRRIGGRNESLYPNGKSRKNGNTAQLLAPFIDEMEKRGNTCETIWLYDKKVGPCHACRACQKDWTTLGCWQEDDLEEIANAVLASDLLIMATPIYTWYCTAPMKMVLDRFAYVMNKYYTEKKGPALWAGLKAAIITTCGYPVEVGTKPWEDGFKYCCKHSQLRYMGMLAERQRSYQEVFMDADKEARARAFAASLCEAE